tara:strand:- start:549 stop:1484 length:936 start_codon:yes stop_codon:yes gene_type:complete
MVSASQLPVLANCSRFKTPSELLKDIMNAISGNEPEQIEMNEAMHFGNLSEGMILKESAERLKATTYSSKHPKPYFHNTLPFACSLDGDMETDETEILTDVKQGIYCVNSDLIKLEGKGILEAKLTSHEPENPSDLPLYRGVLQLQMQMDTTGAKWGAVCVLYKGTELRLFVYERDEAMIAEMHHLILDFQRRIDKWKSDDVIEWYETQNTAEASRIFDEPEKQTITLDNLEDSAYYIDKLRKEIKQKEAEIERTSLEIMDHMHDYEYAIAGSYKIGWNIRNYKATAERIIEAKPARSIRQSKLKITHMGD